MPSIGQQSHTNFVPTTGLASTSAITYTVNQRTPAGDFSDSIEDMLRQYVNLNWSIDNPSNSVNPPVDFTTNIRFADFDYDGFATYHVKVSEQTTTFNNDLIANGVIQFQTPVLFELTTRRLKYGKIFEELDNARLEIVRIVGNYTADDISGISRLNLSDVGDIAADTAFINKGPKSIWRAQVIVTAYYAKSYSCNV